jgi:hypothetical protein
MNNYDHWASPEKICRIPAWQEKKEISGKSIRTKQMPDPLQSGISMIVGSSLPRG